MKNKITACILAILLGWIGVHKFYLGKWGQWILYALFCWTYIPLILWFIEWLYYLILKKEEFDIMYNTDYMQKRDYYLKNKNVNT